MLTLKRYFEDGVESRLLQSNDSLSSVRHLLDAGRLRNFFAAPGDLMSVADVAALREFKSQLENHKNNIEHYYAFISENIDLVELENHYIKMREHEKFIQTFFDSAEMIERYLKPLERYKHVEKPPHVCKYARTAAVWLPHFLDKANIIESILCAITPEQFASLDVSEIKRQELLSIVKSEQETLRASIEERLVLTLDQMSYHPDFVKNALLNTYNKILICMSHVHQAYKLDEVFDRSIEKAALLDALSPTGVMTQYSVSELNDELLRLHRLESGARVSGYVALSAEQIDILYRLNQEELDFQIYAFVAQKKPEDRAFFARILLSKYLPNIPYKQLFVDIIKHQPTLITYFLQFNVFLDSFAQFADVECFQPLFDSFSNSAIELNKDSFNELSNLFANYINRPQQVSKSEVDEIVADIDSIDNLRRANCYLITLYRGPQPVVESALESAPMQTLEQVRPHHNELHRELQSEPDPGAALTISKEISKPLPPSANAMVEELVPVPAKSPGLFKRHPWIKWALLGAALAAVIILAVVSYGGLTPLVGAAVSIGLSMGLLDAAALGIGMTVICVSAVAGGAALLGGIRSIISKVVGKKADNVSQNSQPFRSSQAELISQLQVASVSVSSGVILAIPPQISPRSMPAAQVSPDIKQAPTAPASQKGKEELDSRTFSFG